MNALVFIGLGFALLFGVLGVIFLVITVIHRNKAKAARLWPTVPGTILSAEMRQHNDSDAESGVSSVSFEPVVSYSYGVGAASYTASRIAFGANQFDHASAQKILARYPVSSPVTVHYDPQNARNAVLEINAAGSNLLMIFGIVFIVIALSICCLGGLAVLFAMRGS
jgi:hypothetical protein